MGEKQVHREREESHHMAVLMLVSWFGSIFLRKFLHFLRILFLCFLLQTVNTRVLHDPWEIMNQVREISLYQPYDEECHTHGVLKKHLKGTQHIPSTALKAAFHKGKKDTCSLSKCRWSRGMTLELLVITICIQRGMCFCGDGGGRVR